MSWPFLLIIIPLLRYTKIDLYCAIFQTHIGFSYSISVKYVYSPVFTLCPKRLVGAPGPPSLWAQCALIGRDVCEARCCDLLRGADRLLGRRYSENKLNSSWAHTNTHSRSKNNKCGLILSKKKVYNAVRMGLQRAFLRDPNLVARKTFTHLNSRCRYLVCFKHHKYTNNNKYLQVVYPNLPLVQTK